MMSKSHKALSKLEDFPDQESQTKVIIQKYFVFAKPANIERVEHMLSEHSFEVLLH